MARKKKSEMTFLERVDRELEGSTWEQAEEVGIEILARVTAYHIYAREDGEEYVRDLIRRICKRGDQWAHEDRNLVRLAFAYLGHNDKVKKLKELLKEKEAGK